MKERDKQTQDSVARKTRQDEDLKVQGEGDYAADRRYRERTDNFLKTADVEKVARAAAPKSPAEAREMVAAEKTGRSHAHLPAKRKAKQPGTPRA